MTCSAHSPIVLSTLNISAVAQTPTKSTVAASSPPTRPVTRLLVEALLAHAAEQLARKSDTPAQDDERQEPPQTEVEEP